MKGEIFNLIKSDFIRYGQKPTMGNILLSVLRGKNHCFSYSFWLRLSNSKSIFRYAARFMYKRLSVKHGLQIHYITKIGHGLFIGHGIGIVVHKTTIIGNNCNLSQFTTIGANDGKAAVIGDNVYIGPSVCLIENVHIGNNVTIGAGAVVTKNIPPNATVAGVPAKILSYENPGRYIRNRYV